MDKIWLKQYPDEIPHEIEVEKQPLHYYLRKASQEKPNMTAIHFMGKEMNYQNVYQSALQFANQLINIGIKKGDRVALMLPNCPQAVIGYYGVLLAGGIVVQTNPLYTERELEHQLIDSGAKVMVCLDLVFPRVTAVKDVTELEHIIVTSIKDYLPFPKNILYPFVQKNKLIIHLTEDSNIHLFQKFLKKGSKEEVNIEINPTEDLALLQYTGGTTGPAKGVMLTHYNLVANTMQSRAWMYRIKKGEDSILGALPFFHVYGMTVVMNLAIMYHSKMVIVPRFDAEDILKTIHRQKPTLFPGAPTMYIALLHHPKLKKYDLSSVTSCISGSAPLPVEVQDQFEKVTNGTLVEGYGLTEASPVTHANLLYGNRVKGSIGLPWPNTDAAILSAETGEIAGINEIGELIVRGPQVMCGYWNKPEETSATFYKDWLLTGDIGYMDENGYFYIVDRKKDMIIAGGYNIYPREVEEVLYEHPQVQEVAVVGVPDPYRGETVKAFIVLKDNAMCSEAELNQYCRKRLAAFKVPHIYEFRDELPKTAVGKILRRVLVDEEKRKYLDNEESTN